MKTSPTDVVFHTYLSHSGLAKDHLPSPKFQPAGKQQGGGCFAPPYFFLEICAFCFFFFFFFALRFVCLFVFVLRLGILS